MSSHLAAFWMDLKGMIFIDSLPCSSIFSVDFEHPSSTMKSWKKKEPYQISCIISFVSQVWRARFVYRNYMELPTKEEATKQKNLEKNTMNQP